MLPLVYEELRRLAAAYLRSERRDHTLQPTALVNEAYMKLVDQHSVDWRNRAHFLGVAANTMRRVLATHGERRRALKRSGGGVRVTLAEGFAARAPVEIDFIALNDALDRLSSLDSRQAQVVELRYFGGLTFEEAAEVLGVSVPTVKRDWSSARLWLMREMKERVQ